MIDDLFEYFIKADINDDQTEDLTLNDPPEELFLNISIQVLFHIKERVKASILINMIINIITGEFA